MCFLVRFGVGYIGLLFTWPVGSEIDAPPPPHALMKTHVKHALGKYTIQFVITIRHYMQPPSSRPLTKLPLEVQPYDCINNGRVPLLLNTCIIRLFSHYQLQPTHNDLDTFYPITVTLYKNNIDKRMSGQLKQRLSESLPNCRTC